MDTQHPLQKHTDHRRFKHSFPLNSLMQISLAWAITFSCSQGPHLYASVHHVFYSGSTLQFSLCKASSIQLTQCRFTLGQEKGMRETERERRFLIPKSISRNTTFADVDHGSFFLLYRSLNIHMLYHPIHIFL